MAGLYIHNVKLPESAFDTLYLAVHHDGTVEYDGGPYGWQTTTATPVPPHGRLGDLDRLEAKWANCDHGVYYDKMNFVQSIQKAPTVIPASKECE